MQEGFKNELKIVDLFDGKRYSDLSSQAKMIFDYIFKDSNYSGFINAGLCNRIAKPDVQILILNKKAFISIKSNNANSLHFENIKSFVLFLRSIGISTQTQKTILYYHYGDGTLDGSGKKRYLVKEVKEKLRKELIEANKELNKYKNKKKIIDRVLFDGTSSISISAGYVYHGDDKEGVIVSRELITEYVLNRDYRHLNSLHIGPIILQPYLRDVNNKSKHQEKRDVIQAKWHYFKEDLYYIKEKYEK